MEGYAFCCPLRVRVTDINYGGHVGNARVLDYFQEARIAYLEQLGGYSELDIGGPGLILPEAHVVYRAEMFLGDELMIGVRVAEVKNSSFLLAYRVERGGEVTAEGTTSMIAFDYRRRRPVRLPETIREALATSAHQTK